MIAILSVHLLLSQKSNWYNKRIDKSDTPSNVLQAGGPCVPFFRRAAALIMANKPPRWHPLSRARHQLGIRVTWHFFKMQRLRIAIRPLQVDFLKLEPRCPDVSKTHNVFFCSAKQTTCTLTHTQMQVPLQSPQPSGDVPRVPTIKAAELLRAVQTIPWTGAPKCDLKSSQALKPRPTPPRGSGHRFQIFHVNHSMRMRAGGLCYDGGHSWGLSKFCCEPRMTSRSRWRWAGLL